MARFALKEISKSSIPQESPLDSQAEQQSAFVDAASLPTNHFATAPTPALAFLTLSRLAICPHLNPRLEPIPILCSQ